MTLQTIINAEDIVIPTSRPINPRLARIQLRKMYMQYNGASAWLNYYKPQKSSAEIAQQEAQAVMEEFDKIWYGNYLLISPFS